MGILTLLLLVLVLGALILGITLWATGGRSTGSGEMSCGGCGYAVRGLQALNCPECGADLRMVGIKKPKSATTRNVGIALTIGTLMLLLTCMGWLFMFTSRPTSIQTVPTQIPNPSTNQSTTDQPLLNHPALIVDDASETPDNPPVSEEPTP